MNLRDLLFFKKRPQPNDVAGMAIPEEWFRSFQDGDQFLVSYPRTGNTWTRYLLSDVIRLEYPGLAANEGPDRLVPPLHRKDIAFVRPPEGVPRIFKSHNLRALKGRRMAYLFRQPADSLVSYFHYLVRQKALPNGDHRRPDQVCLWLLPTWLTHLQLALENQAAFPDRTLFASYEMLLEDGLGTLRAIARFYGLNPSDEVLQTALDRNSFSKLRSQEEKALGDVQNFFFRKGRRGSGQEELKPRTVHKIEEAALLLYSKAAELAASRQSAT